MRILLATFLLIAASALSWADDPPGAKPAPVVVSIDAWCTELARITGSGRTTIDQIADLRKLVGTRLVERLGRVFDVRPHRLGERDTVLIEVCGVADDAKIASFVAPPDESGTASKWAKGDQLRWIERPTLLDDGVVRLVPLFEKLDDLGHGTLGSASANSDDKDDSADYIAWLKRYANAWIAKDRSIASAIFDDRPKSWTLRAKAAIVNAKQGFITLKFAKPMYCADQRDGLEVGTRFGIDPTCRVEGIDAEQMKALRTGTQVEVLVTFAIEEVTTGKLRPTIRLVRVREAQPASGK